MTPLFDTKARWRERSPLRSVLPQQRGMPRPSAARRGWLRPGPPPGRNDECLPLGSLAAALWPFLARTHEAHLCWIYLLPPEAGRLPSSVTCRRASCCWEGLRRNREAGSRTVRAVPGPARPGHGHGGEQCFLLPGWQTGADQDGAPAQEDTGPPRPPEWEPRQMEQREGASSAEIASEGFTVRVP